MGGILPVLLLALSIAGCSSIALGDSTKSSPASPTAWNGLTGYTTSEKSRIDLSKKLAVVLPSKVVGLDRLVFFEPVLIEGMNRQVVGFTTSNVTDASTVFIQTGYLRNSRDLEGLNGAVGPITPAIVVSIRYVRDSSYAMDFWEVNEGAESPPDIGNHHDVRKVTIGDYVGYEARFPSAMKRYDVHLRVGPMAVVDIETQGVSFSLAATVLKSINLEAVANIRESAD